MLSAVTGWPRQTQRIVFHYGTILPFVFFRCTSTNCMLRCTMIMGMHGMGTRFWLHSRMTPVSNFDWNRILFTHILHEYFSTARTDLIPFRLPAPMVIRCTTEKNGDSISAFFSTSTLTDGCTKCCWTYASFDFLLGSIPRRLRRHPRESGDPESGCQRMLA